MIAIKYTKAGLEIIRVLFNVCDYGYITQQNKRIIENVKGGVENGRNNRTKI